MLRIYIFEIINILSRYECICNLMKRVIVIKFHLNIIICDVTKNLSQTNCRGGNNFSRVMIIIITIIIILL